MNYLSKSKIVVCIGFFYLVLGGSSILTGQNWPLQIAAMLDSAYVAEEKKDTVKAHVYLEQLWQVADSINDLRLKGEVLKIRALIAKSYSRHYDAVTLYDSAYQYYELADDTMSMVKILNNLGDPLSAIGDCQRAVNGFNIAQRFLANDYEVEIYLTLKFNHAKALMFCQQYQAAIKIGEEAIELANQHRTRTFLAHLSDLVAYCYIEKKPQDLDKAIFHFSVALPIAEELADQRMLSAIYNNRGLVFLELEDYELAIQDFTKSLEITHLANAIDYEDGSTFVNLGIAYQGLKEFDASIEYFEMGIERIIETENIIFLSDAYQFAADAYADMGNYKKHYEYSLEANQLKDSILNLEIQKEIQALSSQYENEKLKRELVESNLEISESRNQQRFWASISIITLLIGALIYLSFRTSQKRLAAEVAQNRVKLEYGLLRAQMNPHFLFNSLNSIQGFFAHNQFSKGNELLTKFSKLIRMVLEQCAKPAITLGQELETLQLYLDLEKLRLGPKLNFQIELDSAIEEDFILVPPLIIQPFVENATWHGISPKKEPGNVWIKIKMLEEAALLQCIVEDDGVGMNGGQVSFKEGYQSKGIEITRARLGEKGKLSFEEVKNELGEKNGIRVTIHIPIINENESRNY